MDTFLATSDTVGCTRPHDHLMEIVSACEKHLGPSLAPREDVPGGLRLAFHPTSAIALRQPIDVERGCCSWITFALDGPTVTMTGVGEAEARIRGLWSFRSSHLRLQRPTTQ